MLSASSTFPRRKKLVAGNWKMHGTRASVVALARAIRDGVAAVDTHAAADIVVIPASIHIPIVSDILAGSPLALGAQNFYPGDAGAFTGEVSLAMLKEFGCTHILVGHSERRQLLAESLALIAEKCWAVVNAGLTPILCVGETQAEREQGDTEKVIATQLCSVAKAVSTGTFRLYRHVVIAYEPVWAIGTGLTATPEQAQAVHAFIRNLVAHEEPEMEEQAASLRILYGGSVKASNAAALFAMPDIDGALVGGASLEAQEFLAIWRQAL